MREEEREMRCVYKQRRKEEDGMEIDLVFADTRALKCIDTR